MIYARCTRCGLAWGISIKQVIPKSGYVCPHCTYEFDPTNNDLLQGVVENYPKILHIAADLQQLLRGLKTGKADYPSVFEKNQDLLLTCKAFIIGCLGEKEYSEIFSQRRPNNVEHVELCTFLYRAMMQDRENMLMEYLGDENDPVEAADYA